MLFVRILPNLCLPKIHHRSSNNLQNQSFLLSAWHICFSEKNAKQPKQHQNVCKLSICGWGTSTLSEQNVSLTWLLKQTHNGTCVWNERFQVWCLGAPLILFPSHLFWKNLPMVVQSSSVMGFTQSKSFVFWHFQCCRTWCFQWKTFPLHFGTKMDSKTQTPPPWSRTRERHFFG